MHRETWTAAGAPNNWRAEQQGAGAAACCCARVTASGTSSADSRLFHFSSGVLLSSCSAIVTTERWARPASEFGPLLYCAEQTCTKTMHATSDDCLEESQHDTASTDANVTTGGCCQATCTCAERPREGADAGAKHRLSRGCKGGRARSECELCCHLMQGVMRGVLRFCSATSWRPASAGARVLLGPAN